MSPIPIGSTVYDASVSVIRNSDGKTITTFEKQTYGLTEQGAIDHIIAMQNKIKPGYHYSATLSNPRTTDQWFDEGLPESMRRSRD